MSKKAKIVLALMVVIILFIIGFAIFQVTSLIRKSQGGEQPLAPAPIGQLPVQPVQPPQTTTLPQPPAQPTEPRSSGEASVAAIALPFTERFGSYSNQSEYEHLQDLLPFMTENFKKWAQGKIEEQMKIPYQPVYQAVTTKSLSYAVKMFDEAAGLAELTVSSQRKEVIGSEANSKVYVQDIDIKMVKQNDVWLVDHAFWK